MYNLAQRANAIFAFAMTVHFGLLLAIAISSLYIASNPIGKVDVKELNIWLYNYDNKETEFAFIEMNIDADLTSLFNWNTKQLFVAVVAEYETKSHELNQVVLWDSIIQSKEDAHIKEDKVRNENEFVDITPKFGEVKANYSIYWDLMPYVGYLMSGKIEPNQSFSFPAPNYYN
ncbi:signal peptidase 22 kDa subunit [Rhizophagus irregularis]|uniref:Signal peptidase subunit 3 n=3 Tax=Rhizophagus irregularis TaxID=588596 RepID=A0A2I1EYL8_9GLOM|nr:signal peptidase 22kDa subunit [Rhizophagus irregularis DAOM 181602=DAOM 197198]EXX58402.1 Spc3p [Rhizophagus irregularis DAOM 197198w]PKC08016.1 signal peptidase 22 kDa subunit [Rhizophagus irregularis]PKC64303.1 signal peptidase 22 kDa subunit [Rhizophagus irregularis]PKY27209.1 signal peptidase 22 kDa subunit [Rhizophagus irregularis]POG62279.1 signal peptidase 22kDa subunit [Rhizophagus irregularis DAOM 181602=DAOM 197198]|eukprot:XP_025169145.1 signal peptidase 22kDa subunit [Rhizophagus irregularis DAOM 181602=DAOM 197198]